MGLLTKFFNMTRKPEGFLGKLMVKMMNGNSHKKLAEWGFKHLSVKKSDAVLDCGCGGGANVGRLLKLTDAKVTGLDYSEVSVEQSKKHNIKAVEAGRCEIVQGNVLELPFDENSFDIVTAFETVYFWPEIEKSFAQVLRVLKPGGTFMITNESARNSESNVKWESIVEGMKIYTKDELEAFLKSAGFDKIETDELKIEDMICVVAHKAS